MTARRPAVLGLAALACAAMGVLPDSARAAPPTDGSISLTLLDQRFAVQPGQPWQASFRVDGTVADVLPPTATTGGPTATTMASAVPAVDADLRVVVYRPADDRRELAEVVDGEAGSIVDSLTTALAPSLRVSNGVTTLEVDVPTTTDTNVAAALTMRRPGLYPTAVQIVVDGVLVAEHRTLVERLPVDDGGAEPLNLAMLAAVADPGPAPEQGQLAAGRRELAAVAELAGTVEGPVSVILPPVLLAGLADDDPVLSQSLGAALAGDEVVSQPSEPLDPSSAVAIGEQEAFTRRLREGEDLISAALPGMTSERSGWLSTSPLSTDAAIMLRDLGFDLLDLDMATYSQLDGNIGGFVDTTLAIDVDLGTAGVMPAIVMSSAGALLDPPPAMGATDAAVRILAELAVTRRELGADQSRSVILATPAVSVPDPAVAAALGALADDVPYMRLVPLSELSSSTDTMRIDGQPQTVTLPETAGPDLRARAERVELTRLSAESAASMQLHENDIARWRAQLDDLLSTGLSDAEVDAVLASISAEAAAVRGSVIAPRPFDLTLTGRSSTLRLNLRNNAAERLRVVVRARSPKLTFPDGDQTVELAPAGVTEVVIPVETRSNGTSSIEVDLLTPAIGQRVGDPVVLTANVNALTGLGQVITGGALLVLGSWWFGHFRRRRRQRAAESVTAEASPPDTVSREAATTAGGDDTIDMELNGALVDGFRRAEQPADSVREP